MGKRTLTPVQVGDVYDKYIVRKFAGNYPAKPGQRNRRWWLCDCACGTKKHVVQEDNLRREVTSCGCNDVARKTKHGGVGTPEYFVWTNMIQRTTNPKNPMWKHYGGRGLRVCKRWRKDFTRFLKDLGPRLSDKHSIERPNVNSGYHCGKCKHCVRKNWKRNGEWATDAVQARNTTRTHNITWKGRTQCATDWALEYKMPPTVVLARLNRGWELSKALKVSVRKELYTFQGKKRTLTEWCHRLNLKYEKIRQRIQYSNWSVEKALTTP